MQTLEAVISFLILISIFSYIMTESLTEYSLDDSLYRFQLVNDVWRVLYLREDLKDLSLASGDPVHDRMVSDLDEIYQMTGLCGYVSGIRATSCPGTSADIRIGSVGKAVYEDGMQKTVTLTVAKPPT